MEIRDFGVILLQNLLRKKRIQCVSAALEQKITDALWVSIWDWVQPLWRHLTWEEPWGEDWYGEI